MKVLCTQIGARQYYEVPARLSLAGQLALLVTDFWNPLGCRNRVDQEPPGNRPAPEGGRTFPPRHSRRKGAGAP